MVKVIYPNNVIKIIKIDIHKSIVEQLGTGWVGLVWNGINIGLKVTQ